MKLTSTILLILALLSSVPNARAEGEDAAGETAAPVTPAAKSAAAAPSEDDEDLVDEPLKKPARSPRKQNVRRSRLTKDVTEAKADRRKLILGVGEDKFVDLDFDAKTGDPNWALNSNSKTVGVTQITEGTSAVRRILFRPVAKGEASITVRDADGQVRVIFLVTVTDKSLARKMEELSELFRDIEGIELRLLGEKIVIDGDVLVLQDYGRIVNVLSDESYAKIVLNLVGISPVSMAGIAREIKRQVNTFAPNVTTRVVNGYIFLEGTVDNAVMVKRVEDVADTYLALPENRLVSPIVRKDEAAAQVQSKFRKTFLLIAEPAPRGQDKMIRVTVHFVELFKDYMKFFGFRWNPGFSSSPSLNIGQQADGNVGASGTSFSATLSNLFPKLNTLQSSGFGRILKQTVMIGKNNEKMFFSEKRTVRANVAGGNGASLASDMQATSDVTITPRIFKQTDDVEMAINFKKSDFEAGSTNVTTLKEYDGKVYIRSAESAAIAASDLTSASTDFNRGPANDTGSEGTEAIFNLNRSKNYNKRNGQIVIFVTPQIIENASDGSEDLRKNFRIKVK